MQHCECNNQYLPTYPLGSLPSRLNLSLRKRDTSRASSGLAVYSRIFFAQYILRKPCILPSFTSWSLSAKDNFFFCRKVLQSNFLNWSFYLHQAAKWSTSGNSYHNTVSCGSESLHTSYCFMLGEPFKTFQQFLPILQTKKIDLIISLGKNSNIFTIKYTISLFILNPSQYLNYFFLTPHKDYSSATNLGSIPKVIMCVPIFKLFSCVQIFPFILCMIMQSLLCPRICPFDWVIILQVVKAKIIS